MITTERNRAPSPVAGAVLFAMREIQAGRSFVIVGLPPIGELAVALFVASFVRWQRVPYSMTVWS